MWFMKHLTRVLGGVFQVDKECPYMRARRPSERLTIFDMRLHLKEKRPITETALSQATSATKWQRDTEDTPNTTRNV